MAASPLSAVNAFISVPGLRGGALAPSMSLRDHVSAYAEPKKAAESAGGLLRACCRVVRSSSPSARSAEAKF